MKSRPSTVHIKQFLPLGVAVLIAVALLGGCDEECVNCVDPGTDGPGVVPPVAPTNVYSESGDAVITVYWSDFPEFYTDISVYRVWARWYTEGDEFDPDREFFQIAEVPVGHNYDAELGKYHFRDDDPVVENGTRLEYAVSAVAVTGEDGDLSRETVVDSPLPVGEVELFDAGGSQGHLGGFDFSLLDDGVVDPNAPNTSADVRVVFRDDVPYLETIGEGVRAQDFGTFENVDGGLFFEGVYEAPSSGYSASGVLELIENHIYILAIEVGGHFHYAKLGVASIRPATRSVRALWAYQLIEDLPELSEPRPRADVAEFLPIRL